MIKEILQKIKPLFSILVFITICSCEFKDDEKEFLGKDEVELYAAVVETADSFVVSGYFRSLNSLKKSSIHNIYTLYLDVKEAINWKDIDLTITADGVIQSGLLGEYGFGIASEPNSLLIAGCSIDISKFELNKSHMQENFSIIFRKNVNYKINILRFEGVMSIGVKHIDGLGCGDYMKTEYAVFEINQTIESI